MLALLFAASDRFGDSETLDLLRHVTGNPVPRRNLAELRRFHTANILDQWTARMKSAAARQFEQRRRETGDAGERTAPLQ